MVPTLQASPGHGRGVTDPSMLLPETAHTLRAEGFDASEDGTGRGIPLVANPLTARMGKGINTTLDEGQTPIVVPSQAIAFHARQDPIHGSVTPPLDTDGASIGIGVVQGGSQQDQFVSPEGVAPTLAHSSNSHGGHYQPKVLMAGDKPATIALDEYNQTGHEEVCYPLRTASGDGIPKINAVAPPLTATNDPSRSPQSAEVTAQVEAVYLASMVVRRLMPVECERLQGFPDGYTLVPYRNKPASDGPRYKGLGNSMAVPCMAWIGRRIAAVDALLASPGDRG